MTAAATKRALELLEQHGDSATRLRDIDQWAYFPSADARANFIEQAIGAGFELRHTFENGRDGKQFGVILFHVDVRDGDLLAGVRTLLGDLAARSGGEYDGWETQIVA